MKGNTDTKSLVLGLALNHSKAAVGSSEVMEVNVSHLILFTDLCVEFASPVRMCRPQADMEGASPLFLGRAVASTFTESHRRGRGAHRSKGNKSKAYTLPVCVALRVNASVYTCVHACIRLCVRWRWVATLINSPVPSHR